MTTEPPSPLLLRSIALSLVLAGALLTFALHRRPGAAAHAPPPAAVTAGAPASAALLYGEALDLNAATEDDLAALPGIGPVRARAIVDERRARGGRFASVDDLLDVNGIGPITLARLRASVTVGDAAATR